MESIAGEEERGRDALGRRFNPTWWTHTIITNVRDGKNGYPLI